MMTYLLNLFSLFNPKNDANRTDFHRVDRYSGSHYMLGYLKTNAFKKEEFDAKKIIPVLKKYVKIQTMELNKDDMSFISQYEQEENKNIDDYRYMTKFFWSEILEEPKHILPHPHVEWKIKHTGYCPRDPIKEMYEFLTLNWAVDMAHQKCKYTKDNLHQKPIYDLVMKELKESNEIESIKSIEEYQNTVWNSISTKSGMF